MQAIVYYHFSSITLVSEAVHMKVLARQDPKWSQTVPRLAVIFGVLYSNDHLDGQTVPRIWRNCTRTYLSFSPRIELCGDF